MLAMGYRVLTSRMAIKYAINPYIINATAIRKLCILSSTRDTPFKCKGKYSNNVVAMPGYNCSAM